MNIGKIVTAIVGIVLIYYVFTWFFGDSSRSVFNKTA